MRKHKPFDPDQYAKILKLLSYDSARLEAAWQLCIDDNEVPEDEQFVHDRFMVAISSVNTAVKYRENTGAYHSGN